MDRRLLMAVALLAVATVPAHAAVDDARAKGLKWLVQTQKGDGSFSGASGLDTQATAAAVEAMLAGGMAKSPQYARALSWLANASVSSTDARAWQVLALKAAGQDVAMLATQLKDDRNMIGTRAGVLNIGYALWGQFPGYGPTLPDTALANGALRSAGITYSNDTTELTDTALCFTLGAQLTAAPWNGAFPLAFPQNGQPANATYGSALATAQVLYEYKKQRQANRFIAKTNCSKTSPAAIDTGLTNAKTWLLAQINPDGGWAERHPQTGNLESSSPTVTALAIRALDLFAAEGDSSAATAVANARNWLASPAQQNGDGSWRSDPFVTARVIAAFPAASGAQIADTDNDGIPDVVEQLLGTASNVADAQTGLKSDANAQSGITASAFSAKGILGQMFAFNVPTVGGTAPYTYVRTGGSLPAGLTLNAGGQISGTPSSLGTYAFDYQVTDALGVKSLIIGRIDIEDIVAAGGDGDVPIPAWALIALGGALLGAARRKTA